MSIGTVPEMWKGVHKGVEVMIFSQGVLHKEECVAEVHVILRVFSVE